jgi:hypothetical protein
MEPRFHRARTHAQPRGNLRLWVLLDIALKEHLARLWRQET